MCAQGQSEEEAQVIEAETIAARRAGLFGLGDMTTNVNQLVNEARPIVLAVAELVERIKRDGKVTFVVKPSGPIEISVILPADQPTPGEKRS